MYSKLLSILKEQNIVNDQIISEMSSAHRWTGENIIDLLIDHKYIEEESLLKIYEEKFGCSRLYMDNFGFIDFSLFKKVNKDFLLENNMIPLQIKDDVLWVVTSNPIFSSPIDFISFMFKCKVKVYCSTKREIKDFLDKMMKKNISMDEDFFAVNFVNFLYERAIDYRASDIHMEPFEKYCLVRLRIDGTLYEFFKLSIGEYNSIILRVKVLAVLDISERRTPQDGKCSFPYGDRQLSMRISTLPTIYGEKLAIRILNESQSNISLKDVDPYFNSGSRLKEILKHSHGIFLITGPTGSGKTTTLYSMIREIDRCSTNITTIEDPVEYTLFGINQVNVNEKYGVSFAKGLRCILRQDPDVIMIGEIRDTETAEIAIKAANTGHLVLTTLHTNDALSSINRLMDIGIQSYLLSDALIAVSAQRLIRKICPFCAEKYYPSEEECKLLCINKEVYLHRGKGCSHCNFTGYIGRTALFELVNIDDEYRRIIRKGGMTNELRNYSNSLESDTLFQKCRELILKGVTTTQELIKLG